MWLVSQYWKGKPEIREDSHNISSFWYLPKQTPKGVNGTAGEITGGFGAESPSTVSKKKAGISVWVLAVALVGADPHYKPCSEETTLDFLVFGGGGGGLASRLLGSGGATWEDRTKTHLKMNHCQQVKAFCFSKQEIPNVLYCLMLLPGPNLWIQPLSTICCWPQGQTRTEAQELIEEGMFQLLEYTLAADRL